jgi:putative membrane protein
VEIVSTVLVGLVAAEHLYILYLEMFLWTKPKGMKVFGTTPEQAENSKVLAANQGLYNGFLSAGLIWGLYNGFLSAGLIWGLMHPIVEIGIQVQVFFLLCVIVAGIYGGLTAKRSIMLVQGLPAVIALLSIFIL